MKLWRKSREQKEVDYNIYLDERNRNIESKAKHSEMFDKSILTLAAGALGLSITFIKNIVDKNAIILPKILVIAWACFAISILSTLISFKVSDCAFKKQIEILDKNYLNDRNDILPPKYNNRIEILNYTSIGAFIFGVILLIIFTVYNLKGA